MTDNEVGACADNDNTRFRGGSPALNWLAKKDPDAALAMFHRLRDEACGYGAEAGEAYLDPRDRNPDDAETHVAPDQPLTSETLAEPAQDGPDEWWPEMLHEIKPGLHEMLRSAGGVAWPWSGERIKRNGQTKWLGEPWRYTYCLLPLLPPDTKNIVELGGLTFYTRAASPAQPTRRGKAGGMLLSYVDDTGTLKRPAYKSSKPRGGKRPHRGDPAGYIALPAAVARPGTAEGLRTAISDQPALMPMLTPQTRREPRWSLDIHGRVDTLGRYGVAEARSVLEAFGIDGSVPFERLPYATARHPTAVVAKGARFAGGITGRCQTASAATVGKAEEPPKMDERTEQVLEEVAARGTLESLGNALGYSGGYADRAGQKALLAAGRALVSANDNAGKQAAA
ncbi:hypothetical protein [Mesorhizobium sp.]|uniref:hypothetical protein n=1 Tax=Mesorhizobium sp. TaxID=1871066 RepID=UPI000FE67F2E|nr:hypothetical protein [Mesorhizobium sp.]RWF66637.1 MAG: hypothetical protein EOS47_05160 [Mesorhizobium sp.]